MNRLKIRSISCGICGLALAISAVGASNVSASHIAAGDTVRNAWPAETLTGTIMMVEPNSDLVVVQSPDHVPFDMRVARSTRILSGDKTLKLPDLSAETNHAVSVTFVPTGAGDITRVIHIMS